jgi:carbonic anhydrase/acetyltransferase-like protein (isoleucine patch superfamily)
MLIEHEGCSPTIDPTAYVAPTATLSGDVRVGPNCRVLFGAVLTAEGGPVEIGADSIIMENAVLRGTRRDPLQLGRRVLVGPTSCLTGCQVDDEVFLATGSRVFNGASIGTRSEIRINGLVHLRTVLRGLHGAYRLGGDR